MATISNNEIAQSIYSFLKDKKGAGPYQEVVDFLNRRRLISKSTDILARLEKIINKEEGLVQANLLSTLKINEADKKDIAKFLKQKYGAKAVVFKESLDPKLLGGFRLEVNDEIIDLSIKNKIGKLQEYLTNAYE